MSSTVNLSKAADQCVMCGMCLPHCPTYQVSQHEAESPRGRISLIKAFAEGQLTASRSLETHIQSCTGCLKCQQICPAKVNYQAIIDTGKDIYRHKQNLSSRFLQRVSIETSTHAWGHSAIRLTSRLAKGLPIVSRHVQLLKRVAVKRAPQTNRTNHRSIVNIFPGCTGSLFDQQTLNSLITLLDAMGIGTQLPKEIICCGALSQHSGLLHQAENNIAQCKEYFSKQDSDILLSFASGCGRQLSEHLTDSPTKHFDASHWLNMHDAIKDIKFSNTSQRVLIHNPCSLNILEQQHTHALLKRIPDIELVQFNDNLACCGAGGLQLTSPQQSNQRLIDKKINTIRAIKPDIIVSSNIGCALNFQLGLENTGLDIEVIHPLTLLARQLVK